MNGSIIQIFIFVIKEIVQFIFLIIITTCLHSIVLNNEHIIIIISILTRH